jgi:hypothetical protein
VYEVVLDYGEPALKEYPDPLPNIPHVKYVDLNRNSLDITKPYCVTGAIANKNQHDTIRFKGRQGQPLVIQVIARRNDSPLDGIIKLYDDAQVKIAESDDSKETINVGEYIQHVDPYLSMTLPKDGEYRLVLADRTQGGGADYRYWLRIGPPIPDFTVYSTVSFVNIPVGSFSRVKFMVDRKEGFTNEVKIVCDDFALSDNTVGATNIEKSVTFNSKDERTMKPTAVSLFAEAVINGNTVRKPVIAADQMMQAFAYNHLLPAENFYAMQYRVPSRKTESSKKSNKKK